jgi:putative hydrolase of the HAD superfamily
MSAELRIDLRLYDAVILDFGGVLMNIDYFASSRAFEALGLFSNNVSYSQQSQTRLFDDLETGLISPDEFRNEIKLISENPISDEQIDAAWNAMILDFPKSRIAFLKRLKTALPLYLLSNTNAIHHACFSEKIKTEYHIALESLFDKTFYSHQIGMRKPNADIFEYVVSAQGLNPSRTLFIDDSIQHVEGAVKVGLQAFLLPPSTDIEQVLYGFS